MVTRSTHSTPLICSGHTRPVTSLCFSGIQHDGSYCLILGCKDGKSMLRDGMTGDWLGTFVGHKGAVWSASLSRDSSRAVTGSADFSAKLWDGFTGECLADFPHEHIVRAVDISRKGDKVATGGMERKLRIYDLGGGTSSPSSTSSSSSPFSSVTPTILKRSLSSSKDDSTSHDGNIKAVVWDETSNFVYTAAEDKSLCLWDLRSGNVAQERKFDSNPTSLFTTWDPSVLTLTVGKEVHFINTSDISSRNSYKLDYAPSSASIFPSENPDRFVTGASEDGWVRVHDTNTGEEVEVNKGHHGPVYTVSYSPDGELYASGSEDGTVRLWQTTPKTFGLWRLVNEQQPEL